MRLLLPQFFHLSTEGTLYPIEDQSNIGLSWAMWLGGSAETDAV